MMISGCCDLTVSKTVACWVISSSELSDVTFSSLPGPKEVESVALGAEGVLEGIRPGSIYVDLSSSRPTLIREIEPKFRQKGCYVLDAPVSGGKTGAESGNLAVMVG